MKKTSKKHFELFKKEFLKCVDKWKIIGWKIYFEHREIEDDIIARVLRELSDKTVTIEFNLNYVDQNYSKERIVWTARHEAAHLLLGRIAVIAESRFVTDSELCEAEEEIVNLLIELLP